MTEIEKLQWQVEALMNRVSALEAKANSSQQFGPIPASMPIYKHPLGTPIDNYPRDAFGTPLAY